MKVEVVIEIKTNVKAEVESKVETGKRSHDNGKGMEVITKRFEGEASGAVGGGGLDRDVGGTSCNIIRKQSSIRHSILKYNTSKLILMYNTLK